MTTFSQPLNVKPDPTATTSFDTTKSGLASPKLPLLTDIQEDSSTEKTHFFIEENERDPLEIILSQEKDKKRTGCTAYKIGTAYKKSIKRRNRRVWEAVTNIFGEVFKATKSILEKNLAILGGKTSYLIKPFNQISNKVQVFIPVFILTGVRDALNSFWKAGMAIKRKDNEQILDHSFKAMGSSAGSAMGAIGFFSLSRPARKLLSVSVKSSHWAKSLPIIGALISGFSAVYEGVQARRVSRNAKRFEAIFNREDNANEQTKMREAVLEIEAHLKKYKDSAAYQAQVIDRINEKYKNTPGYQNTTKDQLEFNEKLLDSIEKSEIEIISSHFQDLRKLQIIGAHIPPELNEQLQASTLAQLRAMMRQNPRVSLATVLRQVQDFKRFTEAFRTSAESYLTKRVGEQVAKEILKQDLEQLANQLDESSSDYNPSAIDTARGLLRRYQQGLRKEMKFRIVGLACSAVGLASAILVSLNPVSAGILAGVAAGIMLYQMYIKHATKLSDYEGPKIFNFRFADYEISKPEAVNPSTKRKKSWRELLLPT